MEMHDKESLAMRSFFKCQYNFFGLRKMRTCSIIMTLSGRMVNVFVSG